METIGRYRITGRIDSGSFATVYRGLDESLDVPVAVKVLSEKWTSNDDVRARFLAEARLLRRIADEHAVRVYDIGTTGKDQPYFVMDLADGGSFEQLRRRLVAPGLALRLCAEACRALEVLHRHQLVHRDVTPGNLLLSNTPGGVRVLIADLGVAKSMLDEEPDAMTAGTPAYMAPEAARSTHLDQRSDLYSMACVTYAMLTGRAPFPIRSLQDLLDRDTAIGPAPIAAQLGAPELLDSVLAAALSTDPSRRPQTALQFADALDRLAETLPGHELYDPRPIAAGTSTARPAMGAPIPDAPRPGLLGAPAGATVAPDTQTPSAMLDRYIGAGRYRPAATRESHSPWFYLIVGIVTVGVLAASAWLTVYLMTR